MRRVVRVLPVFVLFLLCSLAWSQEHQEHFPAQDTQQAEHGPAGEAEHGDASTAAGGHGEGEHEDHHAAFKYSPSVQWIAGLTGLPVTGAYWLALLINFAIIGGAVLWAWRKFAPAAFRSRTADIQKGMEEARRASEDAQRRLGDVESRLARLDTEIAALRTEAESEAMQEEARIRQAAEQEQEKIVEAARQEIEAAGKQARRELKAYAANLAVSLAEKRIQVDTAADRVLVGNFVEQLANGEKS